MHVRPLTQEDVAAADEVARDVLYRPDLGTDIEAVARVGRRRIAHLQSTDPGGCFVAQDDDGTIVGLSISLIREGVWGYSLFAVAERVHGRGLGRALFDAAWDYGRAAGGHIILSSAHPAAMRLYGQTGLPLLPCIAAAGIADLGRAPDLSGVRDAGAGELHLVDAIGRDLRGAGLPVLLVVGTRRVLVVDRAFPLYPAPRLTRPGARDDEAAALALWGAFARMGRGATVSVDFLTAGQDWAVQTCLTAGLALSPDGPMFAGGDLGPMRPYLPSGSYL